MLPISSIAFAAEYNLNIDKALEEPAEIEQEFLQKLEENQLPTKYYRFLQKHNIQNSDQLLSEHYSEHKQRLVEEYIQDYKEPMLRSGGGFSVF